MKELHSIECAKYAVAQDLQSEPDFNWWVNYVLKKRERSVSLVKKRSALYLERNEKFGIALPKTVEEVHCINKRNDNTMWVDATATGILNAKIAFKLIEW